MQDDVQPWEREPGDPAHIQGMDKRIYEIEVGGEIVYASGTDKYEAWAKVGFGGQMVDSMTRAEFDERFPAPGVL